MKVALIQARGNDRRDYGAPPGFRLMKQMAETEIPGVEVEIFSDYRLLIGYQPDIVGIGAVTPVFDSAKYLAGVFKKELDVPILLGGYHITFLPSEIKSGPFDIGILGEGEQTFLDLLRLYREHGAFPADMVREIPGLVFAPDRERERIECTAPRDCLESLDVLPIPVPAINRVYPKAAALFSSRGCPYHCRFCTSTEFWRGVRFFSPERMVREIAENIQRLDVEEIHFLDDLAVIPRGRFFRFAELVRREKWGRRISFQGFVRANLMDEEIAKVMKSIGFGSLRFGAESGSERVLKEYKPQSSVTQNQRAIDLAVRKGMRVSAAFMVGFPGETEEDLQATADFIRRNRPPLEDGGFYLFQAYPGSAYWNELPVELRRTFGVDIPWNRLNLDFRNPDFDPEHFLYFNEDVLPQPRFLEILCSGIFPREWLGKLSEAYNVPTL